MVNKCNWLLIITLFVTTFCAFGQDALTIKERLTKRYGAATFLSSHGGWWSISTKVGNNKFEGACSAKGDEIIPPIYDDVSFYGEYFKVKKGDKVAIRDLSNRELIPFKYNDINWYQIKEYEYCEVKLNEKVGVVDKNGREIIPCKYDVTHVYNLKDGYCQVELKGKVGIVNKLGVEIVPVQYSHVHYDEKQQMFNVSNGNVCGKDTNGYDLYAGSWGVIRLDGSTVIPCEYENGYLSYLFYIGEYIRVNKGGKTLPDGRVSGGKWGMVDKTGKVIIPCKYDGIGRFSEELCPVNMGGEYIANIFYDGYECTGGKWGYVDNANMVIIPIQYDDAKSFEDGAAMVSLNRETTLIQNPKKHKANIDNRIAGVKSEVDMNIPERPIQKENIFVFIYANENYNSNRCCIAALNDGNIVKEYCVRTLGIPERNINLYKDVTLGNLRTSMNRMKDLADAYEGDIKFLVYYSGLGLTDEKTSLPYLLPVDVSITNLSMTGYNLYKFYSELENLSSKSVFVIIDTSFNGTLRDGQSIVSGRGVAIKQGKKVPEGNVIVLTATSDSSENAFLSTDGRHGMMTYFLLKKIKETKGEVTYQELSDYVISEVKKNSLLKGKLQVPQIHFPYNSNMFNLKIR